MKFLYQSKEESLLLKIFMKELLDLILKICVQKIRRLYIGAWLLKII